MMLERHFNWLSSGCDSGILDCGGNNNEHRRNDQSSAVSKRIHSCSVSDDLRLHKGSGSLLGTRAKVSFADLQKKVERDFRASLGVKRAKMSKDNAALSQHYEKSNASRWRPKTKKERQGFAAAMRRRPTEEEYMLNKELRWLKRDVKRRTGKAILLYTRQQLKCGYILDFYFKRCRLAVEVDGPYHNTKRQRAYDERRDERLAKAKIKTLRFTNQEVMDDPIKIADIIYKEAVVRYSPKKKRRKKEHKRVRGYA